MTSTLLLASDPRSNKVAGFVMFFSVLLLVEGTTRVNLHILPGGPWRGSHTVFPPIVAVISAVGEMIFSFFGLCVGFFALALGKANRLVLMACLATELVFGWFVFVVYVLAMPSFAAARMPAMSDLSPDASRALVLMGLTGSIAVCAALQGGQFMFTNILLGYTTGKGKVQSTTLWRGRLYFFAFLVVLKGVSEIVIGSLIQEHVGGGRLVTPVVEPPYVITQASLVIADGIWVSFVGLIGIAVAGANLTTMGAKYSGLCLFTLLVQLALYDVGSVGLAAMAIPVGSLQVILTTALMVMPAYSAGHLNVLEDFTPIEAIAKQSANSTVASIEGSDVNGARAHAAV